MRKRIIKAIVGKNKLPPHIFLFVKGDIIYYYIKEKLMYLHRLTGPAFTSSNNKICRYFIDNVSYQKESYYRELHRRKIITTEELFLQLL